jgi:hypothetical protein
MTPEHLYLDLLKKSITDTLHGQEPDAEVAGPRYIVDFMRHYIHGRAVSMVPRRRLDHLQACVDDVIQKNIPGDLMETGVWRGGVTILMRALLKLHGIEDRKVWAADSFQGLPEPDAERFPKESAAYRGPVMKDGFNRLAVDLDAVKANFARYGMLDSQVVFLPGWFKDTLPGAPIERLAVLRLDGDFYESTRDCLVHLYDKLSVGGYLIVDDYGEDQWTHCRAAVDEFRVDRGITDPLMRVDTGCWYWVRTR